MSTQLIRPLLQSATKRVFFTTQATRAFGASTFVMAEGSTGAPRSGGAAASDAFTKRENASEELFIRQQERDKLLSVKKKIAEQQQNLKDLDKFIDDITTEQKKSEGGQQK